MGRLDSSHERERRARNSPRPAEAFWHRRKVARTTREERGWAGLLRLIGAVAPVAMNVGPDISRHYLRRVPVPLTLRNIGIGE
jgi:hypothetical protein